MATYLAKFNNRTTSTNRWPVKKPVHQTRLLIPSVKTKHLLSVLHAEPVSFQPQIIQNMTKEKSGHSLKGTPCI